MKVVVVMVVMGVSVCPVACHQTQPVEPTREGRDVDQPWEAARPLRNITAAVAATVTGERRVNKIHHPLKQTTNGPVPVPLLTIVRFPNSQCRVGGRHGTCYTATQCRERGGEELGACGQGFGVCCYKEITCGATTSANGTYLVSPGYPSPYGAARTCTLSVARTPGTCQLRLDFDAFHTFPPNEFGHCLTDQFIVPGEHKFKFLCGTAPKGWHFYVDVAEGPNPTEVRVVTGVAAYERRFRIRVSMIECAKKVPGGCGQYLTGNTGVVQSFNYGGFYLAGLDYGICFRKEKNKCTTTLRVAGPSFIRCPNDLYRLPVGRSAANLNNPLATLALFCQLDTNFAPFASLAKIKSPFTTVSRGPLIIWHRTDPDDDQPNYHSTAACTACAGFYQTYIHNDC